MSDLPTTPYESTEDRKHLPAHLERIAQRDYVGVNEGYWILRDAATALREAAQRIEELSKMRVEANNEWRLDYMALSDERDALRSRLAALIEATGPFAMYAPKLRELSAESDEWPDDQPIETAFRLGALRALAAARKAALEAGNVRDDETRAERPADRAPEAGEQPAQDE